MSFGIDVAQYQSGLDYAQARREGVEFVIVKASGFNTGELYVANGYKSHVDRARGAGLAIGHYYVVGGGDPIRQANYFVDNLYNFDREHDVLALDNEPLDSNATFWGQDNAYAFLAQVQRRTGIPWSRLWLYCPASLTRSNPPWNKITDAGIRIWWAAYGGGPTGHTPDHTPALNGKIARWDIHQFSSSVQVAGRAVDGNYSPHSVATLFGGAPVGPVNPGGGGSGKLYTTAVDDGDPGSIYWTLVQTIGRRLNLYGPGYLIDGKPGKRTREVETILLARILNGMKLGKTTTADRDGDPYNGSPSNFSNFVWLGQTAAANRGWYDRRYIDGIDGENSYKGRVRLLAEWLNANA